MDTLQDELLMTKAGWQQKECGIIKVVYPSLRLLLREVLLVEWVFSFFFRGAPHLHKYVIMNKFKLYSQCRRCTVYTCVRLLLVPICLELLLLPPVTKHKRLT